jgi:hydrogenase maturation protease
VTRDEAAQGTLVLGLGNVLCGDDGLGIFALEELRRRHAWPDDVALVDGGTLGLALLPTLESARRVFILDAVMADAEPGTLVALDGDEVEPALRDRLSPHQIGVADLLDAMNWRDTWPEQLRVLGLVPASLELKIGLSPGVARGLPGLVDLAARELRLAGHVLAPAPERTHEEASRGHASCAARALGL